MKPVCDLIVKSTLTLSVLCLIGDALPDLQGFFKFGRSVQINGGLQAAV